MTVPAAWRAHSSGQGGIVPGLGRPRVAPDPRRECTTVVQMHHDGAAPAGDRRPCDFAPRSAYTAFVTRRILIVDDERRIVDMLTEFFKLFQHGHAYEVVTAHDGGDATMASSASTSSGPSTVPGSSWRSRAGSSTSSTPAVSARSSRTSGPRASSTPRPTTAWTRPRTTGRAPSP